MIEDGYSDFLSTNVFAKLSQMPKIDDFYETEQSANEVIKYAQQLNKEHNIVPELLRDNSEKELKA